MNSVLHVCAFKDNYIWLVRSRSPQYPRHVLIVDPGDADPVLATLAQEQLIPAAILCTHHHPDHVGGVPELLQHHRIPVYGPAQEHIASVTRPVDDGDIIHIKEMDITFQVLSIPGHTRGHIAYYGHDQLFCGDTLFSAGCGRLFEGSPAEMLASLTRLAALPPHTAVYCGHEYTLANLQFIWGRPVHLHTLIDGKPTMLSFDGTERLIETRDGGKVFEIGKVTIWEPGARLVFGWRQATFTSDMATEVEVLFEAVGEETRVTVSHVGWDSVPQAHLAKHGFPEQAFLARHGEWWRVLLGELREHLG